KWSEAPGQPGLKLWRVSKDELQSAIKNLTEKSNPPAKLLLSADGVPLTEHGYHDPNYVLVLDREAASWLVTNKNFNLYGTSWKSSDYEPGSRDRPIHKILLGQAILLEYAVLNQVPQGRYFLSAFPLRIEGGSESPVCPVLFEFDELKKLLSV